MATKNSYQNRIELIQGTLDMLILKTLQWGEQHGYGISQAIRANSGDVLQVDAGSLYPALHRLERQKGIKSEWRMTENNQRANRENDAGDQQVDRQRDETNRQAHAKGARDRSPVECPQARIGDSVPERPQIPALLHRAGVGTELFE